MNRRNFLIGCGAGAALVAGSRWRLMAAPLQPLLTATSHTTVVIFLRGGCDGLQLVAPVSDTHYHDARPKLLRVSDTGSHTALGEHQNTAFALHPRAMGLKELFDAGNLAVVHSCGLTNGTRSHFDAMHLIERGVSTLRAPQGADAASQAVRSGWMARYLEAIKAGGRLPGVAASGNLSEAFAGYGNAASIESLADYQLSEGLQARELIEALYANDPMLGHAATQTLETVHYVQASLTDAERKALDEGKPGYPSDWRSEELSRSLQNVAQLIKMDAGCRMINVDYGGWDTHEHQDNVFPELVQGLSDSVAAFYNDIEQQRNNVTVVIMSEFGRRVRANQSLGTDHGHGNAMLVLGGNVKGGKHYGTWPGLHPDVLDRGVDLAVTTDYRNVLSNVLQAQMGMSSAQLPSVFPGFEGYSSLGLFG